MEFSLNFEYKKLSKEEQKALCDRRDSGDESAIWELAKSVFPMAIRLAANYCKGVDWWDIDAACSAAFMGAYRAAKDLNPDKGSITTHAHYKIKQALQYDRMKYGRGAIWVPINVGQKYAKEAELCSNPASFSNSKMLESDLRLGEDPVVDEMIKNECVDHIRDAVEEAIRLLPERSAYIIRNRKLSNEPMGLKELGEQLSITKERVRQLEIQAMDDLKRILLIKINPEWLKSLEAA